MHIPAGGARRKLVLPGDPGWQVLVKTTDEIRKSSATPRRDEDLWFPVMGSAYYAFRLMAFYHTVSSDAGLAYGLWAPVDTSGNEGPLFDVQSSSLSLGVVQSLQISFNASATNLTNVDAGSSPPLVLKGVFKTLNPGIFEFRWAQRVSAAVSTLMRAGSRLEYRRVA